MNKFYQSKNYLAICYPSQAVGIFQYSYGKFLSSARSIMLSLATLLLLSTLVACAAGGGGAGGGASVDADGDGLIEITTAAQLNQMRYNLQGSSITPSQGSIGNANGCGNGKDITECNGYELGADISLADYDNWEPIGSCSTNACTDESTFFNASFDGNGYAIRDLTITNPAGVYANAAGLFGAISSNSVLRNIHIRSANITGANTNVGVLVGYVDGASITSSSAVNGTVKGRMNVGGLVGSGEDASITNGLVLDGNVSGVDFVGGLVGSGEGASITNSLMSSVIVRGAGNRVGGLVGDGSFATLTSSSAGGRTVSGRMNVGGLIGFGSGATIISSFAENEYVSGDLFVGGLVGDGDGATITSSYVVSDTVRGGNFVGGLVGSGEGAIITSSYAANEVVNGTSSVGGLVGGGSFVTITSSYAVSDTVSGTNSVGGLVGDGFLALITYSYWDNSSSGITEGNYGLPQTTYNLQSQTNFTDIYGNWTTMCADGSRAWNLGTSFQYPALACTSGELTTQRSRATAQRSYAVTELQAIPGDKEVNISWNNPYAQITNISISYQSNGFNDAPPIIKSITEIAPNANVRLTIDKLNNEEYYTFTVDLTLGGIYAGKEGAAPSISIAIGPNNDGDGLADFVDPDDDNDGIGDNVDVLPFDPTNGVDFDNDGVGDNADVDADGDGLIEIATAEQLNQVRYNLLGDGFKASSGGFNNISGCGNGTMVGEDITACNGYELVADISLADYDNWEPIGSCRTYAVPSSTCIYTAALFNSIFDGNGYIISDLTIANPSGIYADGAGLFGGISSDAQLRNIHIRSASITGADINVGVLVGYARGASITNSSVSGGSVSGGAFVGGLVGFGGDASITLSYASSGSVSGSGPRVGGLVGDGSGANITLSYASSGSVSGTNSVGGLVGDGNNLTITSSYASGGLVSGTNGVGGLVGDGNNLTITSSYASGGLVSETSRVGGLIGSGTPLSITSSYWDSITSGITEGSYGLPKTTRELQLPTNFESSIYTTWEDIECDDGTPAWDLGTSFQYPALTCTHGELTAQRSRATAQRSYVVTELQAISGDREANISWNNPYAQITSISISYKISDSDDVPLTKSITEIAPNANVQHTVEGLTNGEYYTFTVSLTLGDIYALNGGTEASISVAVGFDDDNDGILNFVDVDDDGDGLIDIATAEQLNQVNYNLQGNSSKASSGGFGNTNGCGNGTMGGDVTACNGYELVADISLAGYNWKPIGSCPTFIEPLCTDTDELFNSTFDGNGYIISDLTITITNSENLYTRASGLFGAISSYAQLRNIYIHSSSITSTVNIINTGILVGFARGASILNSSVSDGTVRGDYNIGGLIGDGTGANITLSYADSVSVSGIGIVGGLAGDGEDATITLSYAVGGFVSGSSFEVGGLVGRGNRVTITSSYAAGGSVSGSSSEVGGLVGEGVSATITSSYSRSGSVSGTGDNVGGLVGEGVSATITSSYSVSGSVSGTGDNVGGLVGKGGSATITSSYSVSGSVSGTGDNVGGLVGKGGSATITSSYSRSSDIRGSSNIGGLIGFGNSSTDITASYWETYIGGITAGNYGLPKTTRDLQSQTDFMGIYATWTTRCADGSFAWYFGTSSQYPVLTCPPNSDSDRDGMPDITDRDDDNDGTLDIVDAFPLNPTENTDRDSDGIGDNADACDAQPEGLTGWRSDALTDADGDGCHSANQDVDDDGNGLIDIHNATELDQVREGLTGESFAGNSDGCGGLNGIRECYGYELVADISLDGYNGDDWQPIGSCPTYASSRCTDTAALFNSIFDGNGYAIYDLTITNSEGDYDNASGLFGAISSDSVLRNINIRSANLSDGGRNVGLLVGYARGAFISNSSVEGEVDASGNRVGGLVGDGRNTTITWSYAVSADISGEDESGGLVGYAEGGRIALSYAVSDNVSGASNVGGLVGYGKGSWIVSSYAVSEVVSGTNNTGGLVGYGEGGRIVSSYAVSDNVSGASNVGGLVGNGTDATITVSYWDSTTSGITVGDYGEPKTTTALRTPTNAAGIYSSWTTKCSDDSLGWDFGTASQYPVLTCTPGGAPAQR